MKWPIVEESVSLSVRNTKVEYINRTTELMIDLNKCTSCYQCVKACPKDALVKPDIPKGKKVPKKERVPIFPEPLKCCFSQTRYSQRKESSQKRTGSNFPRTIKMCFLWCMSGIMSF